VSEFGVIISEILEDKETLEVTDSEEENLSGDVDLHTGIYSVKMALDSPIPQMIPMGGKKIRIYHRGIQKQCQNCFEVGHRKADCKEERRE